MRQKNVFFGLAPKRWFRVKQHLNLSSNFQLRREMNINRLTVKFSFISRAQIKNHVTTGQRVLIHFKTENRTAGMH